MSYADHPARYSYAGESNWLASKREVVTMNEPHMAPWWFPSNDHPLDKAIVDVRIRVPKGREVISNGELKGRTVGKKSTTWHWRADEPMVPYLAFFAAGDFTIAQGTHQGLPWLVAVSQGLSQGDERASMRLMKRTPGVIAGLEKDLGDYPFSVVGGLTTSLNPGFALENQTRPDLSRGRRQLHQPRRPRARPPVVRRRHRGAELARHLAQRGLRHLHGVALDGDPRRPHGCRRSSTSYYGNVGRAVGLLEGRPSPTPAPPRSSTPRSTAAAR